MKELKGVLGKTILFFGILTIFCGGVYPLVMTGLAQVLFPDQANGSIIEVDGKKYGSVLLAQEYTDDSHLWGRIMKLDTGTFVDENGQAFMYAAPFNISPASEEYKVLVGERVEMIKAAHPDQGSEPIPVDLVTGSGSGLDPHISLAAAEYQVGRLAANTDRSEAEVRDIIKAHTTNRLFGVLGEPVVNVLEVNLALDGIL